MFFPRPWRKPQTASFVEENKGKSKSDRDPERLDLEIIAIGKRCGLSLAEINEFRVRDLFAYARALTGESDEKPRKATQEDIDKFFA
ncbi:MAG: hypothetical protein Q8911_01265 [Bacillota bacterium]|nr:hypothetical protein [Bacillota bacterium]